MQNQKRQGKKPNTVRQDHDRRSQSSDQQHRNTGLNSNRRTPPNNTTSDSSSTNMPPQTQRRICEYFVAKGTCKFGDNCKFEHPAPGNNGQETLCEGRVQLFNLKGCIKSFNSRMQFRNRASFENYLDWALKVLSSGDRALQAEGVQVLSRNDLKDDDTTIAGYNVIRHVIEQVGTRAMQSLLPLGTLELEKHLIPLMNIIVHDAFTKDSSLEKNFHYVIKAVYGTDGGRAVNFLTKVICILELQAQSSDLEFIQTVTMQACFLASRILFYLARFNTDAIGHEGLIGTHARLLEVSMSVSTPLSAKVKRILDQTAPYLIVTTARPVHQPLFPETSTISNRYERYEILVDLPGILSKTHPRHDNDCHEISKISILPTKAEVICPREPYLPLNDIRAPHFLEGPARLFDIQFRLLREDMLGPLRTAVNTILDKLRPNVPISKQLLQQNRLNLPNVTSTRLYYNVNVESILFDGKRGLNFRLRFRQPERLRQQSKEHRMNYWDATKSLEEGSLLALVSNGPDFLCFLTVLKKEPKLLHDQHWCYIDVVPEGKSRDDLREYLVKQAQRRQPTPDSLALVEFPGILLTSYSTILKTLQTCSIHPYLPFSYILCPTTGERLNYSPSNQVIKIPPPLYALDAASHPFQYDLQPLKRPDASDLPLLLPADTSIDDGEFLSRLENETTLDAGQCKSLVAALTRELSLIQGTNSPIRFI